MHQVLPCSCSELAPSTCAYLSGAAPMEAVVVGGHGGDRGSSRAPVVGEGDGGFLQLEEGKGKVRDLLAEGKRCAGSSSPWEGLMVTAA
jgi:hypothetical protein